jgi:hypothetical protein
MPFLPPEVQPLMALAAPRPCAVPSVVPRCILVNPSGMIRFAFSGSSAAIDAPRVKSFSPPVGNQVLVVTPLTPVITKKRRGRMAWAWARAGHMASRNGNAIATPPAPRSRVRRCNVFIANLP